MSNLMDREELESRFDKILENLKIINDNNTSMNELLRSMIERINDRLK